jgi:hypothetical protein
LNQTIKGGKIMDKKKKIIAMIVAITLVIAVAVGVIAMKSEKAVEEYIAVENGENIELVDISSKDKKTIVVDKIKGEEIYNVFIFNEEKTKAIYENNFVRPDDSSLVCDLMLFDIENQSTTLIKERVDRYDVSTNLDAILYMYDDSDVLYYKDLITGEDKVIYESCSNFVASPDLQTIFCYDSHENSAYLLKMGETPVNLGDDLPSFAGANEDYSVIYYGEGSQVKQYSDGEISVLIDNLDNAYRLWVSENDFIYAESNEMNITDYIIDDMAQEDAINGSSDDEEFVKREEAREYLKHNEINIYLESIYFFDGKEAKLISDSILNSALSRYDSKTGDAINIIKAADKNNMPKAKLSDLVANCNDIDEVELAAAYRDIAEKETAMGWYVNGELKHTLPEFDYFSVDYSEAKSTLYITERDYISDDYDKIENKIYSIKINNETMEEPVLIAETKGYNGDYVGIFEDKFYYEHLDENGVKKFYWGGEEIASGYTFVEFSADYMDEVECPTKSILIKLDDNRGILVCRNGAVEIYEGLSDYSLEDETDDGVIVLENHDERKVAIVDNGEVTILENRRCLFW